MKRLLLPLIAAISFPNFLNANPFLKESTLFGERYSSNIDYVIKVTKHYDDFYKTTECKLTTSNSGRWPKDPLKPVYRKGEWQLRVTSSTIRGDIGQFGDLLSGYKFDDGEIVPIERNTIYYIPFSIWSNHQEITFNTGTTYYLGALRQAINLLSNSVFCD